MTQSRPTLKLIVTLLVSGLIVGLVVHYLPAEETVEPVPGGSGEYFVRRVIDGDTFVVDGAGSVRLLGIDSPERGEPGFDEARDRMAELVGGRWVTLHFDTELYDRYDRLLAYPVVEIEGLEIAVCPLMVYEGHAEPLFIAPNHRFREAIELALRSRSERTGY